ncbi:MAG TPA: tail fiber domain-containing protein [Thermoanaerobaculia bacterium]|nr:tail fiber domain-containing protein [Thermoanaerobaculia bacterium]
MKLHGRWISLTLAAALCLWGVPVGAAEKIAKMSVSPGQIAWDAEVSYERITLTVSGPGGDFRREFAAGKAVTFDLSEIDQLVDGSYQYELRITPAVSDEVRRTLAKARRAGDSRVVERLQREGKLPAVTVQSGAFRVLGGVLVSADLPEEEAEIQSATGASGLTPAFEAAQVIADDLIVQGSECVGIDCTPTESFGFDTLRLKENNLRIKFEDTSSSAGYPSTDWQLTANDSASGGANKFSIEDVTTPTVPFTITGGAPTDSLFVASSGRIGLRTATPGLELHLNDSDTPAIRLEQNNTGGFTAQTWDIGGNEANFFIRDLTGGSLLPFRIRPGAPTSSLDIASDGDVGIGTASPQAKLHVFSGEVRFPPGVNAAPGNNTHFNFSADGKNYIRGTTVIADNGGNVGIGTNNPGFPLTMGSGAHVTTGGVWTDASSRDYKEQIQDLSLTDARTALDGLNPVTYKYKNTENEHRVGFIAEDVPALVAEEDRKSLAPMDVVAVLTKVVQEQQKTIDELAAKIAELEKAKTAGN